MIVRGDGRRLVTNAPLVIGLLGLLALLALGVFGQILAPYDPNAGTNLILRDLPNGNTDVGIPPTLPDREHLFGTDALGRDQWSRILAGARLTLAVVLGAAVVRLAIGFTLGLIAGWYGGALGRTLRIITTGIAAIPQLVLAIMLVLVLQPLREPGFIAALALVGWAELVEFLQAEVRRLKERPFMEAARATGARGPRIMTTHLVAALAPRMLTLAALETGAVLLLLAELGLVGLFLAGSTALISDFGVIGTLKERAPEWGQMLGSNQFFAMQYQLSTLLPALFVVIASAIFALLADGLRIASDPFGVRGVLPGTFGVVAKGLAGAVCFGAVGFLALNIQPSVLTMEEGRELAAAAAAKTWPGSEFVAGVARFSSQAHAFDRPQRLTYYFRNERNEVLRIEYANGDRLSAVVRPYETEDELDFTALRPLPAGAISWDQPVSRANAALGTSFRAANPSWLVRAVLTWPKDRDAPVYEVLYGTNNRGQLALRRACCYDAATGEPVDSVVAERVAPPWPVPADCAATRTILQQPTGSAPSYFVVVPSAGLAVGTLQNLVFQGDNFLQLIGPTSANGAVPALERATRAGDAAATATLDDLQPALPSPGASQAFVDLKLSEPGCWTLRLSLRGTAVEFVTYAYPWECRPRHEQSTPDVGITPRTCTRP